MKQGYQWVLGLATLTVLSCGQQSQQQQPVAGVQQGPVLDTALRHASIRRLEDSLTAATLAANTDQETELAMKLANEYNYFALDFPQHPQAAQLQLRRARLYATVLGSHARSAQLLEEIYEKYPASALAPLSMLMSASAYHDAGDTANALRMARSLRHRYANRPEADQAQQLMELISMPEEQRKALFNGAQLAP